MFGSNGGRGGGGFGGRNPWSWSTVTNMGDISEKTKQYLTRVYTTLLLSAGACIAGMCINQTFMIQGIFMTIIQIIGMGFLIYQIHR